VTPAAPARSILYVGVAGGTCQHRANALARLGHRVHRVIADLPRGWRRQLYRVANKLGRPPDFLGANRALVAAVGDAPADLLVWADKPILIRARTLRELRVRHPGIQIVSYSPDDMLNPDNQSAWYRAAIPLYDLHVTTKSYNVTELRALGAREVMFVDNAYEPPVHRPLELTPAERARYGADVSFVGGYERERAETMLALAAAGIDVHVWGYHWDRLRRRHPALHVHDEFLDELEFSKCINATRINLGFLRKVNRDLQTTRSIEIPACGAFLLAERTDEHRRLFDEGREAAFFSSFDELLERCRWYLEHEDERARVAAAGRQRCVDGDYSNEGRLRPVLERLHDAAGARTLRDAPAPTGDVR
jgi:hypothetical protein